MAKWSSRGGGGPSKYWVLNSHGRNSKEHNYPHSHDYISCQVTSLHPSNYSFLERGATRLTEGSTGPSSHRLARAVHLNQQAGHVSIGSSHLCC